MVLYKIYHLGERFRKYPLESSSKKIAIYSDWWYPDALGGAESSAREAANYLRDNNLDFQVFTIKNAKQEKFTMDNDILINRVRVPVFRKHAQVKVFIKYLERVRLQIDILTPLIIARKISKTRPEFIVIHNLDRCGPLLVTFLKIFDSKATLIRIFHDSGDSCIARSRFKNGVVCEKTCFTCKPRQFMHKKIDKLTNRNLFVSQFLYNKLTTLGFTFQQPEIGYPLAPINENITIDTQINDRNSPLKIGYLGRISKLKGVSLLLKSCKLIQESREVSLTLYGDGDVNYIKSLKDYAEIHSLKVTFNEALPGAPSKLHGQVNLIVVPSLWEEPFGKVPTEALLLTKVPVLVSTIGGLPESKLFANSGIDMFETGSELDLSNKILNSQFQSQVRLTINQDQTLRYKIAEIVKGESLGQFSF